MFAKIFSQIFDSSIAEDWQVRCVFTDLLTLCDINGVVDMTPEAIARRTNVPLEIVLSGLQKLQKPDPNSRSAAEEGRRIVLLDSHRDWGWRIVNYCKYREIRSELDRSRAASTNGYANYGGYVYFMSLVSDETKVKIGFSANPWARISELSTGSPEGVVFIGCVKGGKDTETEWHQRFKDQRLNGEWFSLSPDLKAAIDAVVDSSLRKVVTRSYRSVRSPKQKQKQKQKQKEEGSTYKRTEKDVTEMVLSKGLTESDGIWLFSKLEGNGWKNHGQPIKSLRGTIAAWKIQGYFPSQKAATANGSLKPDYSKGF